MGTFQHFNRLLAVSVFSLAALLSADTLAAAEAAAINNDQPAVQAAVTTRTQPATAANSVDKPSHNNSAASDPATAGAATATDRSSASAGVQAPAAPGHTTTGGHGAVPAVSSIPGGANIVPSHDFGTPFLASKSDADVALGSRHFWHRILRDEKTIWLSPFHMGAGDAKWVAPLVGGTAGLMLVDNRIDRSVTTPFAYTWGSRVSNLGAPMTVTGVAVGTYVLGKFTHNEKTTETGMMATEALIHSEIVMTVMKMAFSRQRPSPDTVKGYSASLNNGAFGHFTADGSFPSGHSMSAWALASVFAHQYSDTKWAPFVAYGLASAVSLARIGAERHFPSDVLMGSAIGYLMGRFVYRTHMREQWERQSRLKALIPSIGPSFAHGGFGMSLTWDLDSH